MIIGGLFFDAEGGFKTRSSVFPKKKGIRFLKRDERWKSNCGV